MIRQVVVSYLKRPKDNIGLFIPSFGFQFTFPDLKLSGVEMIMHNGGQNHDMKNYWKNSGDFERNSKNFAISLLVPVYLNA